MREIAYVNGEFVALEDAKVSLEDRANLFGDGVYEALLSFGGKPFALAEHLDRWERSCAALRLQCPYGREEIARIVGEALSRVEEGHALVYMQVSRGVAPRAHNFPPAGTPGVFTLYVRPYPHDARAYAQGESAALVEDIRWGRCDVKSLNLLPNVLAAQEALDRGCAQAILQRDGVVTECASANVYIVRDGQVCTHPLTRAVLPGITRGHLLQMADELGIPVQERPFTVEELYAAQEIFISSVAKRPVPIVRVEKRLIGDGKPGPITRALQAAYRRKIARACGVPEESV